MLPQKKIELLQLRKWRIRKKLAGATDRPRMCVKFTGQHIYVQFIDDKVRRTLAAVSTRDKGVTEKSGANVKNATRLGALAAEAAKAKGITVVVFDRNGARYHGKVKAIADAARGGGLKF